MENKITLKAGLLYGGLYGGVGGIIGGELFAMLLMLLEMVAFSHFDLKDFLVSIAFAFFYVVVFSLTVCVVVGAIIGCGVAIINLQKWRIGLVFGIVVGAIIGITISMLFVLGGNSFSLPFDILEIVIGAISGGTGAFVGGWLFKRKIYT